MALSALITPQIKERCLRVGFSEVLESPLTTKKVQDIITEVRNNQQILTELKRIAFNLKSESIEFDKSISFDGLDNPSLKIPVSNIK